MRKCPLLAPVMLLAVLTSSAGAVEVHVDVNHPACSDAGPGSATVPYCSISAAVDQNRDPGTVVSVHPGFYREQVTLPASGHPLAPIVVRSLATAVIDGADDFSYESDWKNHHKKVWLAKDVDWSPQQVFLNGERLETSDEEPRKIDPGEFRYVEGEGLYANVGGGGSKGDNPGEHDLRVGRRAHGFRLSRRSWVTVEGFMVRYTDSKGIVVQDLEGVTIADNTVFGAGAAGISVARASRVRIAGNHVSDNRDHGIAFVTDVTASTIEDNESHDNARVTARAANGIYLFGSTDNVVQRNRVYDNEDTGLQLARDAHRNVLLQNVSWRNGDHGIDCLRAAWTTQIGNVAWRNHKDGFSVEGDAVGTTLINCIGVDNGLETDRFDLYVDDTSLPGLNSDHNMFWNSTAQEPVMMAGWRFASVEEYASAWSSDVHSIQADPLFVDAEAGDFHLQPGSPAIDSGDSSPGLWPLADADGLLRYDVPFRANTGDGPVPHTDRGAHEFIPVALSVGPGAKSKGIELSAAYPNPSRAGIALRLELPRALDVEWSIHDLQGRELTRRVEHRAAGRSTLRWDGSTAGGERAEPGLYFVRLRSDGVQLTRRLVVIR